MNAADVRAVVAKVLAQIAPEADLSAIPADADLQEELDLDSMDFLNFAIGILEETGVDIPERDYPHLASLQGCVDYLSARTSVPGARDFAG